MRSKALIKPIQIGPITIDTPVILAPMTGVTDLPFRKIVRRYGSGLNVTEMIASQAAIRETRQSIQKAAWDPVEEPVSMQLVGCTAREMGEAARLSEDRGAAIIDINMGCPVRKIVNGEAGSALMRDLVHAGALIDAIVKAVSVPVTLKMRMGWDHDSLNAPELARIAEDLGVKLVTESPDWSVIVAGNWKGRWDICICSMTPTAPRAQVFDFIAAYSADPTVVVVNKDNDSIKSAADITGRKIGVGLGSSEQDYLERHFVSAEPGAKPVVYPFGDLTVVPYQGEDIAFLDLALGTGKRLDGVFTAYSTAKGRVEKDSRFKIVTGAHFFRTSSWVSVEKGVDPEWNAKVAQVIEDLKKDGTIRRISLKWLGYDSTPADEATTTTSSQ